ncbi:MAG: MBOAT family protein [Saprospiraceae bacterium]|nr:MBOAT family protein [Saprospiraceae bacterium]MCB9319478.1 MBOAT family protein [Lewinellaceae bacterium]
MLFNSVDFALFFPMVFLLFWLVANRGIFLRNTFLLGASYLFYGWWDWRFLMLILLSSIIDYLVGLKLGNVSTSGKRKLLVAISVASNLGLLAFFKYYNFFADSFVEAFSFFGRDIQVSTLNIILPVGISFYTFQTMSYTLDIYRKKLKPVKDPVAFLAFVSFFPQLVAGPIERASNLLPQFLEIRHFDEAKASAGFKQIVWGLFMKTAIADRLGLYVAAVYGNVDHHNGMTFVVATFFFAIQIYCDFAGYSLIAIGCAKTLGFDLMDNFNRPYFASSFKDFWSRWHISLSTWFRDYVYIPLGGSRKSNGRTYANLFTTFVISGLWHGANWTFIIWGALHGFFQTVEKALQNAHWLRLPKAMSMIIVFALTCFAWIFFRAGSVHEAFQIIQLIFLHPGQGLYTGDLGIFSFALLAVIFLLVSEWMAEFRPDWTLLYHRSYAVRVFSTSFLILYMAGLGVFDNSQFIYFQF